jgi:hypothetical protein
VSKKEGEGRSGEKGWERATAAVGMIFMTSTIEHGRTVFTSYTIHTHHRRIKGLYRSMKVRVECKAVECEHEEPTDKTHENGKHQVKKKGGNNNIIDNKNVINRRSYNTKQTHIYIENTKDSDTNSHGLSVHIHTALHNLLAGQTHHVTQHGKNTQYKKGKQNTTQTKKNCMYMYNIHIDSYKYSIIQHT